MRWPFAVLSALGGIVLTILFQENLARAIAETTGWNFSSPTTGSTIVAVLIIGLVIGLSLTTLLQSSIARGLLLRLKLKTVADVERHYEVPVVGVLPEYRGFVAKLSDEQSIIGDECYKIVLRLTHELDGAAKRILVTGAAPADGKSSLVRFLAATLARLGQRVLVIDADLRLAQQHRLFDLPAAPGLEDFLRGEQLTKHDAGGIDVVVAGNRAVDPGLLLNQLDLERLIVATGSAYDWVLIDAPPVMAMPDALLLAGSVSATLFTARLTNVPLEWVTDALASLRNISANKVLLVLSRVPLGQFSASGSLFGFRHAFSYAYGYGYGYAVNTYQAKLVRSIAFATPHTKADVRRGRVILLLAVTLALAMIMLVAKLLTRPGLEQQLTSKPFYGVTRQGTALTTILQLPLGDTPPERRTKAYSALNQMLKRAKETPSGLNGLNSLHVRVRLDRWPDEAAKFDHLGRQHYPYVMTIRYDLTDVQAANFEHLPNPARALGHGYREPNPSTLDLVSQSLSSR